MNRKNIIPTIAISSIVGLAACAKGTADLTPQYTSPLQYSSYSCNQIQMEMQAVSRHASQVGGQVDRQHANDQARMGVGLVLFWPTLFFLDGNTPQATEYTRLQGEFDALEKAAIQKNCKVNVERPVPAKPKEETKKAPAYPKGK
jgi:hypothetical protein